MITLPKDQSKLKDLIFKNTAPVNLGDFIIKETIVTEIWGKTFFVLDADEPLKYDPKLISISEGEKVYNIKGQVILNQEGAYLNVTGLQNKHY